MTINAPTSPKRDVEAGRREWAKERLPLRVTNRAQFDKDHLCIAEV
jgi:hypothetical protein